MDSPATPNEKPVEATAAQSMLVVLAKNASKVHATVSFLQRRGIAAKFVQTLNEAVDLFTKKEANMLLLSVNFPHPKNEMLPVLMNQSFQIETILFAEESDRKTSSRLTSAKTKHVLFGPVSGPIVMMKIRQIERDIAGAEEDAAAKDSSQRRSEAGDRDDIKVGGNRVDADETISVSGKAEEEKRTALETLMRLSEIDAEDVSAESAKSPSEPQGPEIYIQKGQRSDMKSAVASGVAASEGTSLSPSAQALRQGLDAGLKEAPPTAKRRLIFKAEAKPKKASVVMPTPKEDLESRQRAAERAQERQQAKAEAEKAQTSEIQSSAHGLSLTEKEIIQKCLREALTLAAGTAMPTGAGLSEYSNASLVSLATSKLRCSFIIAIASSKQAAGDLFYRIEVAFFSLLRDCGFDFENRHTHSILIDNMDIVERAFGASDYVIEAKRPDVHVGVASVLVKNPVATIQPYEENMASVSVQDLPVDEPVTFNVFLHLKRNQKYLRYLKAGGVLSGPQATRLSERHPNVLLDQEDVEAYRRHYAAHSIQAPKKHVS